MGLPENGIWITRHGKTAEKFYHLHKYHAMYSGGVTGFTEFLGSMVRPSISHLNCFCVRLLTSLSVRGHTNFPCSRRLYSRRKPSPYHTIPFMRSAFLPQKRNKASGIQGLLPVFALISAASLSIPKRKSVKPHTTYTCEKQTASFNICHYPQHFCKQLR